MFMRKEVAEEAMDQQDERLRKEKTYGSTG
jgi:hypothetical protein